MVLAHRVSVGHHIQHCVQEVLRIPSESRQHLVSVPASGGCKAPRDSLPGRLCPRLFHHRLLLNVGLLAPVVPH